MYYIEETEKELIKYEVTIDEEKLKNLRKEIIENCSEINHFKGRIEVSFGYNPYHSPNTTIKNYKSKVVGTREYFDGPNNDICEVEYDEYKHPKLVEYIDDLLNNKVKIIDKLKKYQISSQPKSQIRANITSLIQSLHNELSLDISKIDENKIVEKATKLKELKQQLNINKNQQTTENYYKEVMSCIKLLEISRISKELQQQVENFYEGTNQKIKKRGEI